MIHSLSLGDFRNIHQARLEFDRGISLVVGDNGAGKTSLLEALYLAFRGRSFRSRSPQEILRRDGSGLRVDCQYGDEEDGVGGSRSVAVRLSKGTLAFADGSGDRIARLEVGQQQPLFYLGPDVAKLLIGPADLRRRLFDWLMFHVEPELVFARRRLGSALQQRQKALMDRSDSAVIDGLEAVIDSLSTKLADRRNHFWELVCGAEGAACRPRWGASGAPTLYRGWPDDSALGPLLAQARDADRRRGFAGYSAARYDLKPSEARSRTRGLSGGEAKAEAIALVVWLLRVLAVVVRRPLTVLVDDVHAELAGNKLENVLAELSDPSIQWIFSAHSGSTTERVLKSRARVFHVKQGRVLE